MPTFALHPPTARKVPMYLPALLDSGRWEYSIVPMIDWAHPRSIIHALQFLRRSAP